MQLFLPKKEGSRKKREKKSTFWYMTSSFAFFLTSSYALFMIAMRRLSKMRAMAYKENNDNANKKRGRGILQTS